MNISVALCTYNGGQYLKEQLRSISSQTRLPDEVVVCDDKSVDNTIELLREFVSEAPFPIRLYINEENMGSTKNFEKAIGLCKGDIIALSDQDDVWHPEKLKLLEEVMMKDPGVGAVFTDGEVCDASLNPLGYSLWQAFEFNKKMKKKIVAHKSIEVLVKRNVITGSTVAFRSAFKELVLPIPREWVHDGWIVLLIAAVSDLAIIHEPLIRYRQHDHNQIGATRKSLKEQLSVARKTFAGAYLLESRQFAQVKERLLKTGAARHDSGVIYHLSYKVRHLQARGSFSGAWPDRWATALRELLTFRYHRYSNGWKSFMKDFVGL